LTPTAADVVLRTRVLPVPGRPLAGGLVFRFYDSRSLWKCGV